MEVHQGGAVTLTARKLPFYPLEELLAHEALHAARAAFQERRFEEYFAYQLSPSRWRRALGPLWRSPHEVRLFLLSLLMGLFAPAIPLSLGAFLLMRRLFLERTIRRARRHLFPFVKERRSLMPFLMRLTDKEIRLFSKKDHDAHAQYMASQNSLRWKQIKALYYTPLSHEKNRGF